VLQIGLIFEGTNYSYLDKVIKSIKINPHPGAGGIGRGVSENPL